MGVCYNVTINFISKTVCKILCLWCLHAHEFEIYCAGGIYTFFSICLLPQHNYSVNSAAFRSQYHTLSEFGFQLDQVHFHCITILGCCVKYNTKANNFF